MMEQFEKTGSAEIDGISGATAVSQGAMAVVLNALDPEGNPYEGPGETEVMAAEIEPVTFPQDKKVVSATTYSIYTRSDDFL